MKKLLLILVLSFSCVFAGAQTLNDQANTRPAHNLNLTFLGNASLISVNYEKLFFTKPDFFIAGNIGMGIDQSLNLDLFGSSSPPIYYFTLPHYVTGNLGKGRSFFEFGLGGTIIAGASKLHYYLYPIVGYRLQPLKKNKLYFRVFAEAPVGGMKNTQAIFVPLGFSLGLSF